MNDRELETLLRLAAEADGLGPAGESRWPAGVVLPRRSRAVRFAWAVGAAAVLALVTTVVVRLNSARPGALNSDGLRAQRTEAPSDPAGMTTADGGPRIPGADVIENAPEGEWSRAMVLAMFKDDRGGCTCVVSHDEVDLGGRDPADLSETELLELVLRERCSADAERVLVFGLSGPGSSLPRTDAEAEAMAECLEAGSAEESVEGGACLPPSVMVTRANLALGTTGRR